MNATAQVCELKLSPVTSAPVEPAVVYTAQAAYDDYIQFAELAGHTAAGKCEIIRQSAMIGLKMPSAEDYSKVLSGMVARAKKAAEGANDEDIKRETQRAAKFASYCRTVYGALYTGRMTADEVASFTNNEQLVAEARAALLGDGRPGDAPVKFDGSAVLNADERQAKRVQRKAKSLKDAVAEVGALQGFTPQQVADLQAKAEDKAEQVVHAEALAKAGESGAKYGAKLAAERGADVAIAYLRAALDAALLAADAS